MGFGQYEKTIAGVFALMTVSLLFQIVGFSTPGWSVREVKQTTWQMGLWYYRICSSYRCELATLVKFDDLVIQEGQPGLTSEFMLEYQIETCIALTACIIGITLVGLCLKTWTDARVTHAVFGLAAVACFISGILALIASGKYGNHALESYSKNKHSYMFPYSVLFTGCGGVLSCLSVAIFVVVFMLSEFSRRKRLPEEKKERAILTGVEYSGAIQHRAPHVQTIVSLYSDKM